MVVFYCRSSQNLENAKVNYGIPRNRKNVQSLDLLDGLKNSVCVCACVCTHTCVSGKRQCLKELMFHGSFLEKWLISWSLKDLPALFFYDSYESAAQSFHPWRLTWIVVTVKSPPSPASSSPVAPPAPLPPTKRRNGSNLTWNACQQGRGWGICSNAGPPIRR